MPNSKAVPAVSFIVAVILWILWFILNLSGGRAAGTAGEKLTVCVVVGVLVVFSGVRCLALRGPRIGHAVRTGTLVLFAVLTFWKVGVAPAVALIAAAAVAGALATRAP